MDILVAAVVEIANDDYNHVEEVVLMERLRSIRNTRVESKLREAADIFVEEVRRTLSQPGDPEYGEVV